MDKNKNERGLELIEMITGLPEKEQKAIILAIKNLGLIEKICKNSEMTEDEIKKGKKEAIEKEDYLMLILYCAAEVFNNKGNETD